MLNQHKLWATLGRTKYLNQKHTILAASYSVRGKSSPLFWEAGFSPLQLLSDAEGKALAPEQTSRYTQEGKALAPEQTLRYTQEGKASAPEQTAYYTRRKGLSTY
jgi:hypothetical protein